MKNIPRPEHPRPDFYRPSWTNLNGEWAFCEDFGSSGRERGLQKADAPAELFDQKITVPFCRESVLSGLGHTDFCDSVWYRRTIEVDPSELDGKSRFLLHIGACDWKTEIWVNGKSVKVHVGGFISFDADITDALVGGENIITICADDHIRTGNQAGGKQSDKYYSYGCSYTRTTGIWQTVWLEKVPASYIKCFRVYPNINDSTITLVITAKNAEGKTVTAETSYEGRATGVGSAKVSGGVASITIALSELNLWEIGAGRLYDLVLTMDEDSVKSYFGMRSVSVENGIVILNGKRIFQRTVLDQGFYPTGILTAPSEDELIADIDRSLACGFEGARLHQKIFEPVFLYHCDKKGYIVWGEHGNWGMDISRSEAWANFIPEWIECLERDFNHPAIIGWCPLNETQKDQDPDAVRAVALVTRSIDPTRAFIDASGWTHVPGISDILDTHDYEQNPEVLGERYQKMARGEITVGKSRSMFGYRSTFLSEYGGIRWSDEESGWGYGDAPKSEEEFIERFRGLANVAFDCPGMGGLCYTQLTDVEQEVNGLYTYDRRAKFDPAIFKAILSRKAYIELEDEAK